MVNLLIAGIFLISCAIAAGTIFMLGKLRKEYTFNFLSALLFLLVFQYMFGFYSLWGQFLIAYLVQPYISHDIYTRIMDIAIVLGFPFIVFAWLMLIRFCREYMGKTLSSLFISLFLSANAIFITLLVYFFRGNQSISLTTLLKYYYNFALIAAILISVWNLLARKKKVPEGSNSAHIIAAVLSGATIIQVILLIFYEGNVIPALAFIFIFFTGTGFLPVYLNYSGELRRRTPVKGLSESFDGFCKKFEISPREKEIILEICNGLSNQQIADKLFISLQTVKDHTHRIYGKVDVSSRVQLIKAVGDISTK